MADTVLVLGQAAPSAATATTLYTVPASTTTVVSSITACNISATADTIRIWVAVNGAADANKQYIHYGLSVAGNDTFAFSGGLTMGTGDLLRVYSTNGTTSFSAFGTQLS